MQYSPIRKYDLWSMACFDPFTATVAAGLTMAGSAVSAAGTIAGGNAAAAAGEAGQQAQIFKSKQEAMAAQESRAVAQRKALDNRHKATLLDSTLRARGAAGGSNIADGDILDTAGEIAARGEYEALFDMYQGENRARGLEDQATASLMTGEALKAEGEAKKRASRFAAAGTIISGAGSAFGQYNAKPG